VAQGRTLREAIPGSFHLLIWAGFIVLTAATLVVMLDADFHTAIMQGRFYLWFQSLAADLATWILVLLLAIAVTGFLVEGLRIAATGDPWGAWSPVGNLVARAASRLFPAAALAPAHRVLWWFHLVIAFGFLGWAPYTKLAHVLTAPLNIFTANLDGYGHALKRIDFDAEDQAFGVNDLAAFTWKDLLDLDACTECGRCTAACPANAVGKSLSPRDIIVGTTCAACLEACPVYVEQLPKIIDVRRYLVMEEGELPPPMAAAMTSLERRGHPFPGTAFSRVDWAEGLGVSVMAELDDPAAVDYLLWVGCAGALLERNHAVARSVAQLLARAGISFAILGREERCTGDPARRIGNEFLFETIAKQNIALLDKYRVMVADGRLRPLARTGEQVTYHDPCYLGRYNEIFEQPRALVRVVASSPPVEMAKSRQAAFCCGGGGGMSFAEEAPHQRVNRERARQALATGAGLVAVACPFCLAMLEDGVKACEGGASVTVKDIGELLWESVDGSRQAGSRKE